MKPMLVSRDGASLLLRSFGRADRAELVKGFEHLSPESRHRRFLAGIQHLRPDQLDRLCSADGCDHVAVVAVELDDRGRERAGVGIAHSIRHPTRKDEAEYAITVIDEWQGRGIGTLLTRALAEEAWRCGIRRWRATMLAENLRVRKTIEHVATPISRTCEDGVFEIVYALRPPAVASVAPEARP